MSHYVYMILCCNNHYYTGYTTDIDRRYQEHVRGTNKCRYTRAFKPLKLVAYWSFDDKSVALKTEAKIKKLPREQKIKLASEKNLMMIVNHEQ